MIAPGYHWIPQAGAGVWEQLGCDNSEIAWYEFEAGGNDRCARSRVRGERIFGFEVVFVKVVSVG